MICTGAVLVLSVSMLRSETLAIMETFPKQTVHNSLNHTCPCGAIPIIILVGDDFQLPPICKGAFDSILPIHEQARQLQCKTPFSIL